MIAALAKLDPATFLGPCSAATPRCARARSYSHALPECCRGHLVRMVADVQRACTKYGVRWWADYGTLLGAVRNPMTTHADYPWLDLPEGPVAPGIVPHDKDVDLGAYQEDWRLLIHKVRPYLTEQGYDVTARPHSVSLKIRLSKTNSTNVDFFTWSNHGGVRHRPTYISVDSYKGREFPAAWVESFTSVPWEGLTIPAPADPAGFCRHRYGETWKSPVQANHDGVRRG